MPITQSVHLTEIQVNPGTDSALVADVLAWYSAYVSEFGIPEGTGFTFLVGPLVTPSQERVHPTYGPALWTLMQDSLSEDFYRCPADDPQGYHGFVGSETVG